MRNTVTVTALFIVLSIGLTAHAVEEKKTETKRQTHCPVMERYGIDKDTYVDVKSRRIYTCCKGCINQVRANPDKYIKRLEDRGVEIEEAPEKKNPTEREKS